MKAIQYGLLGLILSVCLAVTVSAQGTAQNRATSNLVADEIIEYEVLMNRLKAVLEEIPYNMNRVAFYDFDMEDEVFTRSGQVYLKNRLKSEFVEYGTTQIISIPEFESLGRLNIIGTDSTLVISSSTFTTPEETADRLLDLSHKYSLDGYIEGTLQYRRHEGYMLNIRMTRPSSREVVWSKNLTSRDFEPKEEHDSGSLVLLTIGTGLANPEVYTFNSQSYMDNLLLLDYSFTMDIRQSVNRRNSGYIGIRLGAHYFSLNDMEEQQGFENMNVLLGQAGLFLTKTLFEKPENPLDHWVDFNVGGNIFLRLEDSNMFSVSQGLNINISRNIGIAVNLHYLIGNNPSLETDDGAKKMYFKNLTYGAGVLFRL